MKYLLMIYGNHESWNAMSTERYDGIMSTHAALQEELKASGELVETHELRLENAKVVRRREGVPTVTDGPFSEAKELLAGYYLVDCASVERAVEIASRFEETEFAPVEVRPVTGGD